MALDNLVDDRNLKQIRIQKRVAPDGIAYSKQILTHKRVAPDGIAYTKQEFEDFYGESHWHYRWSQADVAPDDLADVAAISAQPKPQPAENMLSQAPATEHAFQAPATEHAFQNPSHVASDSSMSSAAAPARPKSPPPPVASSSSMTSAAEPTLPKPPRPKSPPPPVASSSSMTSAAKPTLPKPQPPPVASSSSMSKAAEPPPPKRPPPPVASDSPPPPVASSSSRSRAAESPLVQYPLRCPWYVASSNSTSRPDAEPQRYFSPLTEAPQPLPDKTRRLPTVDLPPADAIQPIVNVNQPTSSSTTERAASVATEHAPVGASSSANHQVGEQPLRLMPEDVRAIQRAERDRGPPRSLHQLARNALNDIEDRDPPIDVSLDNEFPWREYIAAHNESAKIIGTGIVQARAVFFKDQRDPNRGGASRMDFCFVRSDDTVCRVHPGRKRSGDAKLRFAPRSQFLV